MFSEGSHYPKWRENRINKLNQVLGKDWWPGKRVLELGCGWGHTGSILQTYGADVTFCEGRQEYYSDIARNAKEGSYIRIINQDKPWSFGEIFDLVIHWGVLYHLVNWKRDLETALKYARILTLDTEVYDRPGITEVAVDERKMPQPQFDQSMGGIGVRPSVQAIEEVLNRYSKVQRFDDSDLNVYPMAYDWNEGEFNDWRKGPISARRFWVVWT